MKRIAAAGLVFVAAVGIALAADRPWVEARSAHFIVASDDGDKTARTILWQFEQIRAAMQNFWPWAQVDLDRPMLVLAVHDDNGMRALVPEFFERVGAIHPSSVAYTGPDRYYVALRSDERLDDRQGAVNPYLNAFWAYTAIVLGRTFNRELPLWYERGFSALMGNMIVRDTSLQVGRSIPYYITRLRSRGRLSLANLLAVDRASPAYTDPAQLEVFDAQSWMFVHYLLFGEDGAHRGQMDRFSQLLHEGKPAATAAEVAFGDISKLENGFSAYFSRPTLEYLDMRADLTVNRGAFSTRTWSPAEAAAIRAGFLAPRRPADARTALDAARRVDAPGMAVFSDSEGLLSEREGKVDQAKAAYAKAIELGSENFYSYYRMGVLMLGPMADADSLRTAARWLDRAAMLDDRFAPTFNAVANVALRLGHADQSLSAAERAVALDPAQTQPRLSLARALWALSRRDEAQQALRDGVELAKSDGDRQAAAQVRQLFERTAAPAR